MCDSPHVNPCGIPQLKVGRDVQGRFRPGNQGGPGNPFARKVAALRKTLLDSVSEQDLKEMVEALKLKARQGDTAAIKLLWQYCVGKPDSPKDPDRMDADEWQRLQEMRVGEQEFWKTIGDVPACLACHRAETYWPCDVQDGPWAQTVHYVRSQLQAGDPFAEVRFHSQITTQHGAQPDAAPARPSAASANHAEESDAPSEPAAPTTERPTSAKPTSRSNGRHEPLGRSRDDRRSLTQPPLPNGGIGQEQRQALKPPQRPRQPSVPSGQAQRKPPRR
jgi:hypothetical protein